VVVLLALFVLPVTATVTPYSPENCELQLAAPTAPRWTPIPDAYGALDDSSEEGDLFMRTATGNPYLSGPGDFGLKSTSAPWTEATHFSLVRLQFTTPKEFHEIETNPIQLFGFFGAFRWRENGFGSCARVVLLKESSTGQLQLFNCGGHSPESFSNISELESSTDYLLEFEMSPKRKEIILRVFKIRLEDTNVEFINIPSTPIPEGDHFQFQWEDSVVGYPATLGHNSPILPSVGIAPDAPHSRYFPRTDAWGSSWGKWSIGEIFFCRERAAPPLDTPNTRPPWFPELKKYTFTHSNLYPGEGEAGEVMIAPFLAFHESESLGTWKDSGSQLFTLVSVALGGARKPEAGQTFFERDSDVANIAEQSYTVWACGEMGTFVMVSMKFVEMNGAIVVSVSGPKRSDKISECPSSGEVARRMNNTINETIAQHESAIGLGVSAIEVDIYMPYELNHLSAEDCQKLPKINSQAMVFLGNMARIEDEVSVIHNFNSSTVFSSSECSGDVNAMFEDLPVVSAPLSDSEFTAFGLIATCEYPANNNKSNITLEGEAAMKIIKLQIVYDDTSTEVSQVETRIKRVEGCHYKTHLASEVKRAWNCAEDLGNATICLEGITYLQIGSLPPSPPASPPSPSSGSLPFLDGECSCVSCYTLHGFKDLDAVEALGKQENDCGGS
jgi:hypothetical protein